MTLCSMLHRLAHTLDEDGRPLPARVDVAVGSYEITQIERDRVIAVVTSGTLTGKSAKIITTPPSAAYFNDPMIDEDGRPLPARPWEPPGPPPKRKLTAAGRMFVVACIVAVAFLALCVLVARFGDYPG